LPFIKPFWYKKTIVQKSKPGFKTPNNGIMGRFGRKDYLMVFGQKFLAGIREAIFQKEVIFWKKLAFVSRREIATKKVIPQSDARPIAPNISGMSR